MRTKNIAVFIFLLFVCAGINAQNDSDENIKKETYLFAVKGTDSLFLDKYNLPDVQISEKKPCIIFMFGGGFVGGMRYRENYVPYFHHLVQKGFNVVSIDYRLGLKNVGGEDLNARKFISIFENAINIAVEDLYDATNFVLRNADEWNIDKNIIIANGSSAGAISVLHGEYNICNKTELAKKLPADFNYAGIISFAGAIFSSNGNIKWQNKPAPLLLFHGDADRNVPYNKVELLQYGFYGSKHIAKQVENMQSPYYFYDVENAAHEMADIPMNVNREEIGIFLDRVILGKKPLMIHSEVKETGKPQLDKNLGIRDYIESNFGN